MGRVKVYDAEDIARNIRETFTAKKASKRVKFPFKWPSELQFVGESLGVAYSSDKWRDDGDLEIYKHISEQTQRALCVEGFLRDADSPSKSWPTIGPMVSLADMPMPKEFAIMAYFEELNLRLHTRGTDEDPKFGRGDEGIVKVTVAHGMLGGAKMLWSKLDPDFQDQPFIFVYSDNDGPLVMIVGDELDIEADGIVG